MKWICFLYKGKRKEKQAFSGSSKDNDSLDKPSNYQQEQGEDFKLRVLRHLVNLEAKRITLGLIILFMLALGFAAFVLWLIFSHVQSFSMKIPPW